MDTVRGKYAKRADAIKVATQVFHTVMRSYGYDNRAIKKAFLRVGIEKQAGVFDSPADQKVLDLSKSVLIKLLPSSNSIKQCSDIIDIIDLPLSYEDVNKDIFIMPDRYDIKSIVTRVMRDAEIADQEIERRVIKLVYDKISWVFESKENKERTERQTSQDKGDKEIRELTAITENEIWESPYYGKRVVTTKSYTGGSTSRKVTLDKWPKEFKKEVSSYIYSPKKNLPPRLKGSIEIWQGHDRIQQKTIDKPVPESSFFSDAEYDN